MASSVPGWHLDGIGDFDGNGKGDILWQTTTVRVRLGQRADRGRARIATGDVASSWHIVGTGDFDGNGKSDILWQNDNGAVSILDNGQISGAHNLSARSLLPDHWHIVATGDFDGNGHTDILWQNTDNGALTIWDNGQIGGAHIIPIADVDAPAAGISSATGDFDGNGKSDILWRNDNGRSSIWDNGQIRARTIATGVPSIGTLSVWVTSTTMAKATSSGTMTTAPWRSGTMPRLGTRSLAPARVVPDGHIIV